MSLSRFKHIAIVAKACLSRLFLRTAICPKLDEQEAWFCDTLSKTTHRLKKKSFNKNNSLLVTTDFSYNHTSNEGSLKELPYQAQS